MRKRRGFDRYGRPVIGSTTCWIRRNGFGRFEISRSRASGGGSVSGAWDTPEEARAFEMERAGLRRTLTETETI